MSELYADRADDIFRSDKPARDRKRMDLDAKVDGEVDGAADGSTARELITKFTSDRANLPDMSEKQADEHLRKRVLAQPKLIAVLDQEPCVRRAYAIFDQGKFHGTERHEGGVTDLDHERRVLLREDPAQPDPEKRAQGLDGCRKGQHVVGDTSTSIDDPVAYIVALVRGIEHPEVRAALERPYNDRPRPGPVSIPIADLLGPRGHDFCKGYQLVGYDPDRAKRERNDWVSARRKDQPADDIAQPRAAPIASFEGGTIQFRFTANKNRDGYELVTMFPAPSERRSYE